MTAGVAARQANGGEELRIERLGSPSAGPVELDLEIRPRQRVEAIEVTGRIRALNSDILDCHRHALFCSHHTTAGFLDRSTCTRLAHRPDRLQPYLESYRRLFPPDAGYCHDQLHMRAELTAEQRRVEPRNGDAHLTFIGSGLRNCVTHDTRSATPVYFVELDGVWEGHTRTRRASVMAYDTERTVDFIDLDIPVSAHAIDSVNLYDERLGLRERINAMLERHPVRFGRIDLGLHPDEDHAAVTVNEYETLLMRHDLAEVLQDPLRFVARQGRRVLEDPLSVPTKSLGYARYDVVRVLNRLFDSMGLSESAVERLIAKLMAFPAERKLRFKRSLSLPVSAAGGEQPRLVTGRYQSPILIQWRPAASRSRALRITLTGFS